jgi:large subunit ribosomal protein L24
MVRIKKNDQVRIITGKDKGKTGKVLYVLPKKQRAIVENINIVKKARRRTQQDQQGGFMDIESPIHLSNLMLADKKPNKPARTAAAAAKEDPKARKGKKNKEAK